MTGPISQGASAATPSSSVYRKYVLAILTLVYTLNALDQNLVSLLLQPIKLELHLSDSQLGLLTGISFAFFYATIGVPIARCSDRGNRVNIASAAMALWGVTVMCCYFVGNFRQLVIARIAAAIGESGGMPPTYSLVGDYFASGIARTRAMTVYMLAGPLSVLISFAVGGWLNVHYGWRSAFVLMGAPGLVIALVLKLTVREPRTLATGRTSDRSTRPPPPMMEVLDALRNGKSTRHLTVALILLYTMGAGLSQWYAAFLIRSHRMDTAELGAWLGAIFGLAGVAGVLLGGHVANRWFAYNEAGQMRSSGAAIALLAPALVLFLFAPEKHQALIALIPIAVACNFFFGPTFALLQRLVIDEMRATAVAVVMLLFNLIGMGIGPMLVGLLSDFLKPSCGEESLRYAMLSMSLLALWAAYHFWQVADAIRADLDAVITQSANTVHATRTEAHV